MTYFNLTGVAGVFLFLVNTLQKQQNLKKYNKIEWDFKFHVFELLKYNIYIFIN